MGEVGVVRIVLEGGIRTFGLSEEEIREVANEVIRNEGREWEVSDIRMNGGTAEIELEFNITGGRYIGNDIKYVREKAKEILSLIERELETYAIFKKYSRIYNNCNGRNGTKDVLEKLGIPVIS